MKRVVALVQLLAVAGAGMFVVLLFVNEPDDAPSARTAATAAANGDGGDAGDGGGAAAVDGQAVYESRCASCHGADGGGGLGPQLAGRMVAKFPDVADQIDVITEGRGGMPGFEGRLSPEEIRAVAEYERSL